MRSKAPAPVVFGAPMIPDPARLAEITAEALSAGWLTNGGVLHLRLEKALAAHVAPGDAVSLVSSGTMALLLGLALGGLPPGSEVITTPLSFAATAQAIAWNGLVPVFADVDPVTLTLQPEAVEAAITPRTSAILPVHFLGVPCDVDALGAIAERHGLWLLYDAAHAFGLTFQGQPIGSFGDASAFSLHATKILHTGEGGFIVTRARRARAFRQMRNFGLEGRLPAGRGLNGKMSELNAAMGLALLPDLAAELAARDSLCRSYDDTLAGIAGLRLHATRPGASKSLGYYVLRLPPNRRERLHAALAQEGIFARDQFPLLCGPGTVWADAEIVTRDGSAPVAPRVGQEVLCLPLHGRVLASDVARIGRIAADICSEGNI
ncbi:DegT/DnrJ/EryC1/StrS family aminotransferase [Pseudogemmobacter blasticus]|uniref:DegT/DnrJ/EryC1/StrS family aminotransferase n=1 Tax=Fuscovulum blasticum DSM 2131 TaxID=1188250 RepID=A0A2T4J3Z3_FUSBL|nr:DegT/DnrJ/EryC1/StrS family aminotransferase [Fuscovulum blasticum]PTE12611.1 DegT/DnrJ/EryC1/StrS family aminotransferase [Fuscovulum blasticum DSM 2131]